MNNTLLRFLLPAIIAVAVPVMLSAQASGDGDPHDGQMGVCGTQVFAGMDINQVVANTARENPALYRQMAERSKQAGLPRILSVNLGTIHTFFVLNRVTQQFDDVNAMLVFSGRRSRIWIDLLDTARIKQATIAALARGLDTATAAGSRNPNKGLIENDEEVFGQAPVNRFDAGTPNTEDFLLTDIKDNISGGNILGYFSSWDQGDSYGSNQMNILYIDSKEGLGAQSGTSIANMIGTLAHEYQHLIHFRTNPQSQTFYNEGCSETASIICGYRYRSNNIYLLSTNVSLMRWSDGSVYNDLEIDYERAMSFISYCNEQYGEAFLTKLASNKTSGINRLGAVLQQLGNPGDWKSTLKGFAVANYVRKNYTDSQYIYLNPLSGSIAKVTNIYTDTIPASGQGSVQQYAAMYNMYTFKAPRGMTITFNATGSYAVFAILYKNNQLVNIRELTTNAPNTISADSGFNRVVFAIVNLGSVQTVTWTAKQLAADVETEETATAGMAIAGVTPNPANGPMQVTYRTTALAPVTMQLFDIQGRMVRTIIEGEPATAGTHQVIVDPSGLAGGVYLIRMSQGAAVVTRAVVIDR